MGPLHHESMEQDMVMLADQENTQGELFQIFHIKFGLKSVHTTTLGVVQSLFRCRLQDLFQSKSPDPMDTSIFVCLI